jgi:glycosyltransferase involved in cell wall biosynthesis
MNIILSNELTTNRSHINDNDECFLLKKYLYNNINITYSVIIPVYNQESIIKKNIESIINFTGGSFEIIIILDFCNDNTENILVNFFDTFKNNNLMFSSVKIFKQPNSPIFEASCDNIGFINSNGKYCLEIQADMEMVMPDYNLHLSKPFNLLPNVFAVSGRCAHNFFREGGIGKLGTNIEKSIKELNVNPNLFYVYETCNRGPLLIDKTKLKELNYLDEKNYHLDNSDHDIIIRAFLNKGYISGYVPIDFISPLNDGTTRKNDKYKTINDYYKLLRINQHEIKGDNNLGGETINKYKNCYISQKDKIFDLTNINPVS